MWVRRMTVVCPKCSGKIKKNGGGELRCADCGMKVGIQEVIVEDDEFGSITGFINSLKDKVASISYTNTPPTSYSSYTGYYGESKVKSFDNFTNQMILNLGYWAGVDENTLNNIREQLSTLSEKEFMKLYNSEEYIRAVKEYYNETNRKGMTEEQMMKNMDKVKELYENLAKDLPSIMKQYQK